MNEDTTSDTLALVDAPVPATHVDPARQLATTPNDLIALAMNQGADLDRLERLWAMQIAYEEREAKKAFVSAMAAFKCEPLTIYKRKEVGYKTRDGFVGYSHAELSDVTDAVGPAMAKHGLSYRWDITRASGRIEVRCIVTHQAGHSESVVMDAAPDDSGKKNAIQQDASACTYLQRYTLLAITGMSTKGMDDDGAGSGGTPAPKARPEAVATDDGTVSEVDSWIRVGQEESFKGMTALTAWWGSLTAKQRSTLSGDFGAMRRCANKVDQERGHA